MSSYLTPCLQPKEPPVILSSGIYFQLVDSLRQLLDSVDYIAIVGLLCDRDRLFDLSAKPFPDNASEACRTIVRLFFYGDLIPLDKFHAMFTRETTIDLFALGVISREDKILKSRILILVIDDCYLILDRPVEYCKAKWTSNQVYFDQTSIEARSALLPNTRIGRFLEVGSGSGYILLGASKVAERVVGIEIDPVSARFSMLNLRLNGCELNSSVIVGDLVSCLNLSAVFDLVVFHPPFRIVPPTIRYLNPRARVGAGTDGLCLAREFLSNINPHVAAGGEIRLSLQIPATGDKLPLVTELKQYADNFRWKIVVETGRSLSIEEQAAATLDKCAVLNVNLSRKTLYEMIMENYRNQQFSRLVHAAVVITTKSSPIVEVRNLR